MRAQILSIGSEILVGDITDTNATFLAQELASQGIELLLVTQVGDDRRRIVDVLRRAAAEADLVICTGGIGPTEDDLTREAIADLAGQTPEVDPELLQRLREHFAARGQTMPERNAKQAWIIPAVETLPNPIGSAPGWLATIGQVRVIAMPGVPREMKRMWREQALPRIAASSPDRFVRSTTLKTIGIGESSAEERIADLVAHDNPTVATYAKDDGVHVRITAIGETEDAAANLRDETVDLVQQRLSGHVYAADDETLPGVLLGSLRQLGLRLGVVDCGSGGQLAALLTSSPLAVDTLRGCQVMPADVHTLSAAELAGHARDQYNAEIGLGLTVSLEESSEAVYRGTVSVAIRGAVSAESTTAVRGEWQDDQRRAALAAAGLLLQSLPGPLS